MLKCCRKVAVERKVAGTLRYLVNAKGLQLECARVSVLLYGSETMIWKEEGSGIRAIQIENL